MCLLVGLLFFGAGTIQSAPPPSECTGYLVSGAGTAGVNGCYKEASTPVCGSSPGFILDATHTLYFYGNAWRLGLCGKNVTYLATPGYNSAPPAQTTATCGAVWAKTAGAAPCPAIIRSNLPPVPPSPPPPPPPTPPSPPPWCTTPGEERPCFHNHGTKYVFIHRNQFAAGC
jgi:hypothetical protein